MVSTQHGSKAATAQPSYFPFGRSGRLPHWWSVVPSNPQTSPGAFGPSLRLQRLNPGMVEPHPDCEAPVSLHRPEQHSTSLVHTSHAGRQPPRNWQVGAPEPSSAQAFEQHSTLELHGSRADWQALISRHSPLSHFDEQHSPSLRHTSPPALQLEEKAQRKSLPPTKTQRFEQHVPGLVGLQSSPEGRQL
jgi:hypothetical protein